jgi:glutamate dehydrogenase (NAD(P)+)
MAGRSVTAGVVGARAQELQLQTALAEIDEGGAAVGLQLPGALSEQELWQLARECAPVVGRMLGNTRLLAEDLASASFSIWMASGVPIPGSTLAVPFMTAGRVVELQNDGWADAAAGFCSMALEDMGKRLRGATIAIMDVNERPRQCLRRFAESGAKIVAVADESGAVLDEKGLELTALLRHVESGGLLAEFPDGRHALHSEAIASRADILVLGAGDEDVTAGNAATIDCCILLEGTGSRLPNGAMQQVSAAGVVVIPQRLVDCVTLIPETQMGRLARDQRREMLQRSVKRLWEELAAVREQFKFPLPTAVLLLGLQRLAEREAASRP